MSISALLRDTKNHYAAPFHALSFILPPLHAANLPTPHFALNTASSVAALSRPICLQHFPDVGHLVSSCEIRGISGWLRFLSLASFAPLPFFPPRRNFSLVERSLSTFHAACIWKAQVLSRSDTSLPAASFKSHGVRSIKTVRN